MKILLTGLPKSGKSTMLLKLMEGINLKRGIFSPEVIESGVRMGFDLKDETGKSAVLSRVDIPTDYPVGRYFVDVNTLDKFIEHLFIYSPEQMLFVDEIGQMQLYSDRFMDLVIDYVSGSNDFIGTVSQVYDHPFIETMKQREDILFCRITPENRESMKTVLTEALQHRQLYNSLNLKLQKSVLTLARGYLETNQYVSLKKLFKNAITYVVEDKVHVTENGFMIEGLTNSHQVKADNGKMICDCDFFNGRGRFVSVAGECSHVQSAKLVFS